MEPTNTIKDLKKQPYNNSYKENIKKYYNEEAESRDGKSTKVYWKVRVRNEFCELIKKEKKGNLLELGAGTGYDSLFFKETGINVTAIDISQKMVKKCKEKLIEAYELDFYEVSSLKKTFDCIWAINTILHVPKSDLRHVLNEINSVLKHDGLLYIGLYGGKDTEEEFIKKEISEAPRFFSFHSEEYLKSTLKDIFQILKFESIEISNDTETGVFYSITMRKRNILDKHDNL